ncbi:MAG: 30S ribosomal protein S20 [Proteobacteria bacterium]|jgi:small subunit ribosomal protein S20|nr:30S ribosomal protein S20 [Pseudomonadota bacterium]NBP16251.1 30S ribosomal protein S20 [bacterium]
MANIKSAQKRARQSIVKKQRNLGRKTAVKTAVKKVLSAIQAQDLEQAKLLLKDAEGQIARAAGKNVLHKKTAMRKTSRLAKRLSKAVKAAVVEAPAQ